MVELVNLGGVHSQQLFSLAGDFLIPLTGGKINVP